MNVSRGYKFIVEIDGIDQLLVQEVTLPEDSVEVVELGAGVNDYAVKLPSRPKIGNITLKKVLSTSKPETWAYDWLEKTKTGKREDYAKFAFIKQLAEDGTTVIRTHDLGEIFPVKIAPEGLKRLGTELFMESVEFAISKYKVTTS